MLSTALTGLVGCSVPVQLAGMPGIATVELAAAVCDAGGIGMLAATMLPPEALEADLERLADATPGTFGVNFLVPFLDRASLGVAARRARIVEFFYGDPSRELVAEARSQGALASWQVGSVEEALRAEDCGCDLVVVQGTEAGGHVRGRTSLLPLLSAAAERLRVPLVAAGGIATGRDLAAVIACGAAGARLGTRFVASRESGAHPAYVAALLRAGAGDTCLTETFSVLWPGAPHRVLRSAVEAAQASAEENVGEVRFGGRTVPVPRLSVFVPNRDTSGRIEAMALYAGESVANVAEVEPAGRIVARICEEAERLLAATP
jgi:nitronate monooxygenase